MVMAEALGTSGKAQVLDLFANSNNIYTPAYAIYESGVPVRVLLFNYVTDSSGAHTYTANINIGGGETGQANGVPASVKVKYVNFDALCSMRAYELSLRSIDIFWRLRFLS